MGFEPTNLIEVELQSTAFVHFAILTIWLGQWESNPLSLGYEPRMIIRFTLPQYFKGRISTISLSLPFRLFRHIKLVAETGFEPIYFFEVTNYYTTL